MKNFPWKPISAEQFDSAISAVLRNPQDYPQSNLIHLARLDRSNERDGFIYLQYQFRGDTVTLAKVPVNML